LGIVVGAVVLYGGGWLLIKNIPSALNAVWAGRLQRVRLPVPAEENSPYSSSPPTFPVVNKGLVSNERVDLGKEVPLWDRFMALETFQEAWQRVALRGGGPGADGVTVEQFSLEAQHNLEALRAELGEGQYHPHPHPRCVEVPKRSGGTRRLVIFSVRERVVHLAAYLVLSPFWETRFAPCSYAYRPRRSANQAVAAVEQLLTQGKVWVVDADIESFFDTVSHHRLWSLLETWLPDVRMLWLLQVILNAASIAPERGLAQGSPLSPLLANVYLHDFDTLLLQARQSLVRYSDDFLLMCATRLQAEEALESVERLLQGLKLRLKAEKTRIVHRDEGFTFLGYTFDTTGKHPSPQAVESLQTRLESAYSEIKRSQIVAGWQGYFGKETLGACTLKEHGPLVRSAVASEPVEPAGNRGPDLKLDDQEDDPWWQEADESGLIDDGKDDLPTNWPASDKIDGPTPCPGNWEGYRLRFLSRPGIFARYWESPPERQGYLPVRRDVADAELAAHMKGDLVLKVVNDIFP
jgi:group II intron reverse transcriptase/maturase